MGDIAAPNYEGYKCNYSMDNRPKCVGFVPGTLGICMKLPGTGNEPPTSSGEFCAYDHGVTAAPFYEPYVCGAARPKCLDFWPGVEYGTCGSETLWKGVLHFKRQMCTLYGKGNHWDINNKPLCCDESKEPVLPCLHS